MDNNTILVHASCYFQDEPVKWAKELAALGRKEGYDYIRPTVVMLEDCHPDNKKVIGLLTMLRQPEWVWKDCTNDPAIRFFGIQTGDEYETRGYYVTGKYETGEVHILAEFGDTADYVVGTEVLTDPREEYEARTLKTKIWKRQDKYFVVLVGRVVDLIKQGVRKEDVRLSGGKGYFAKVPAYAILDGPWLDKAKAQEAKISF